ncbi:MAG: crotonase/enoyl-CoA hydratase family protein [Pseudomonadota bacterium]
MSNEITKANDSFSTLKISQDAKNTRIARITFSRPEKLNAIGLNTAQEIRQAVELANAVDEIHVIILEGEGPAFCAGYDIPAFAALAEHACKQEAQPWDPMMDYRTMRGYTDDFMSLWHSHKPTIAKVQKYAIAGGSDIALCCDQIIMEDDARIGYMPTRVWGCPTTAHWTYRLGPERAKRMLLTGQLIDGKTAAAWGLVGESVPGEQLEQTVWQLAESIAAVPHGMAMMQKMVVNEAIERMGLLSSQTLATLFDGITRHNPEGMWFRRHAEAHGFKSAVEWRDSGRNIPEGDEAREMIAELDTYIAQQKMD